MSAIESVTAVRPPRQRRSREAWERILTAGTSLLEEGGPQALTIAAVCARADVAPTAIYARVDGLAGLFWAVYDWRFAAVREDEEAALAVAELEPAGSRARIEAVVSGLVGTFEAHRAFLEPIVRYSATDPAMRERAAQTSLALVDRVAALLDGTSLTGGSDRAREVARLLHDERVIRVLYGPGWLAAAPEAPETVAQFQARLTALAIGLLNPSA